MTTIQLEYIVAVDSYRHFSLAAEHCCVTQPTLSMQIQKLEEELNVKIFDRSKQPVVPTEVGMEIIEQARTVLKEAEKIKEIIQDKRNEISGELRLGVIPTLAPYLLPLFLQKFVERYPQVKLKIAEFTTEVLIEKLKSNQIDVGLLVTPLPDNNLFTQHLFYEEFVVYLSKSNELMKKNYVLARDIDVRQLWLLEEGHCIRSQIMNLCELKHRYQDSTTFEYEVGSIETLKKMVELNDGITILPELSLQDLNPDQIVRVRRFESPAPVREVSLATHRNYVKKRMIDALKTEILEAIPVAMQAQGEREVVKV
ncbi:LysR substrate-binding domain-containing protein [Cytophagaceae bacterium DM2B3-1]|uniref:LysR substrate-binding domain-containing protein n=1 Tax=Xanthocytophaga flava TaxID=3048013 RepID=A0AAE3QGU4_9BACT|nr:LysR substrate-binding domain-containing protein [Xanthocytophaga flavus]MDJ1466464.1 LysR substrate-binding domain-containing protein [Xanthocytophaga flavus]MDJ1479122.1 LysR substrate-binding domain-containing protein [Xanthocytophaga flavus]MDJ1492459.1 LysR substrate-binding domain-containing protein [Xanthocytophaga flavus]